MQDVRNNVGYASPEQLDFRALRAEESLDMWSAGCIFLEMLVDQPAFTTYEERTLPEHQQTQLIVERQLQWVSGLLHLHANPLTCSLVAQTTSACLQRQRNKHMHRLSDNYKLTAHADNITDVSPLHHMPVGDLPAAQAACNVDQNGFAASGHAEGIMRRP